MYMKNRFITPLEQALVSFWQARFEQVQLQIERNFSDYPEYHKDFNRYHDALDHLKETNPDISYDVEQLVAAMHLYYSDLALEAYRQGAKDWMQMYHATRCPHNTCPKRKEAD